ncbi:pentapeptide repeat-containing protein [Dietzia cinnamea]|uniref:pentapeptide repeat-containing protein n=1 Tax=Dietzia TaxID=37914 RepID=UPI0015F8E946|nr:MULTISPECIES: pentapeptide repeat-containing protein [Dietzia]MBB1019917.1 hypothetical protein [Dietzia sp. E1]MCT2028656.1 pentapeptide repeat-containing protein [Dietzia cinnamea]
MTTRRSDGDHAVVNSELLSEMTVLTGSSQEAKRPRMGRVLGWVGALAFWTITVVGLGGLVVLLVVSGRAEIRENWANNEPWFTGFQAASLAVPIAAIIGAGVAITTARWGLRAERERRDIERRDTTERTLRDRFHELVKLLATDELRAREGAAYAVAALADDWRAHYRNEPDRARAEQQVCIDVLISQLRDPMPDDEAAYGRMVAFKHSIQGIVRSRLGTVEDEITQPGVWSSFNFVFDGCTFHDLNMYRCVFDRGQVSFKGAYFTGITTFKFAHFTGGATFNDAHYTGDAVFSHTRFSGDAFFAYGHFIGGAGFNGARFAGRAQFAGAHFIGDEVFSGARFGGRAGFAGAHFTSTRVALEKADFGGDLPSLEKTFFEVSPSDFPKCEACNEVRARQKSAKEPGNRAC